MFKKQLTITQCSHMLIIIYYVQMYIDVYMRSVTILLVYENKVYSFILIEITLC
jgi:hypothetical protein